MNQWTQQLETSWKEKRAWWIAGLVAALIIIFLLARPVGGKQRVLRQAVENLAQAQSYHTEAQLDLNLPTRTAQAANQPIVDVSMNVAGDVVSQDGSPQLDGTLSIEARGRGMVLFADGQLKLLHNAAAFRLENLPAILNPKGNLVEQWTYVDVPTLETKNPDDVQQVMQTVLSNATYAGKSEIPGVGESGYQYQVALSPEEEDQIVQVFRQSVSGNRSLNILARLLRAHDVSAFTIWVDPSEKEVRLITMAFVKPEAVDNEMANLSLSFSDFGKQVVIEEPPRELHVNPAVFAQIFGQGDIVGIEDRVTDSDQN